MKTAPFSEEHTMAWMLILLYAGDKAGLLPGTSLMLQRLQFLSNTLAPVYGTRPPADLVQKLDRGPFYPEAQRDLDRLAVFGLATLSDVKWHTSEHGCWKTANYGLTPSGRELAEQFIRDVGWCEEFHQFLVDLCFAFGALPEDSADRAVLADLTYKRPGNALGSVIRFSDFHVNMAARATEAFESLFPAGFEPSRQQRLNLYLKFLNAQAA